MVAPVMKTSLLLHRYNLPAPAYKDRESNEQQTENLLHIKLSEILCYCFHLSISITEKYPT